MQLLTLKFARSEINPDSINEDGVLQITFFKLYFNLLICKVILIYFLLKKCLFKFIMEKCANLAKYSLDYKQKNQQPKKFEPS